MTDDSEQPFTEDDIHDYVDGRMEARRRARFEAYLSENPDIDAIVADYRRQNELLRALFGRGKGRVVGHGTGNDRLN